MKSKSRNAKKNTKTNRVRKPFKPRIVLFGLPVLILFFVLGFFILPTETLSNQKAPLITVYKSPTCACCNRWITHLEDNGFKVETNNSRNMSSIKVENGLPSELQSCHTGIVNGYIIEGHVPANDIKALLKQKPGNVVGLAVPRMPMGSPGMEGKRKDSYSVLLMNKDNTVKEFNKY